MKYKVLMYAGTFVDESQLHNGIYKTAIPVLHYENETMQMFIDRAKRLSQRQPFAGSEMIERYIGNFKDCELVEFELKKVDA